MNLITVCIVHHDSRSLALDMKHMEGPGPMSAAPDVAAALLHADAYPHPAENIDLLETHISQVVLAGPYAYKIKKPVDLGFCDFTTLEKRREACEVELRLNQRLAPQLYIDVVEIRGEPDAPRVDGAGPVLEYAVRMHRFPQQALARRMLADGRLTREMIDALALELARFHAASPAAPEGSPFGSAESVLHDVCENFDQIEAMLPRSNEDEALGCLRDWCEREFMLQYDHIQARHARGMTRECHGDLHLGNIVCIDGALVPFDCIEFSARLRWIDVMSEVAFLFMDLLDRGADELAWRFLNAYLEETGDYSGVAVLRFHVVYRAMVRAKVHLIRALQQPAGSAERARLTQQYEAYLALAARCTRFGAPAILLMHGFSGCGKSTIALALAQELGAVRIRSDVERKRLHGVARLSRTASRIDAGLYGPSATHATYARLAETARAIVQAGYTAIVDATFLRRAERAMVRAVATSEGVPIALVDVWAPEPILRTRMAGRDRQAADPSEANAAVLDHQLATAEPVGPEDGLPVIRLDGRKPLDYASLVAISQRLLGMRRRREDLALA
jgi:aminoglycoside phosphotransferase family enzyme/predicted kinase